MCNLCDCVFLMLDVCQGGVGGPVSSFIPDFKFVL